MIARVGLCLRYVLGELIVSDLVFPHFPFLSALLSSLAFRGRRIFSFKCVGNGLRVCLHVSL